jgi:hypothetical protein
MHSYHLGLNEMKSWQCVLLLPFYRGVHYACTNARPSVHISNPAYICLSLRTHNQSALVPLEHVSCVCMLVHVSGSS